MREAPEEGPGSGEQPGRAAEEARDGGGVGEAQRQDEEAQGARNGRRKEETQSRQCSENTLHIVLNLLANATARATANPVRVCSMRGWRELRANGLSLTHQCTVEQPMRRLVPVKRTT